jgi:hypothetical protein
MDYQQNFKDSFLERRRMIRFRRKREHLHFWQEFKVIPAWLISVVIALFFIAQGIAAFVNLYPPINGGQIFPPELATRPALASLALAGFVTLVSITLATMIFLIAYVNRDARRRGMNSGLWTLLVIVMLPAWLFTGFMIYFLSREPLPFDCPQCGTKVAARFNFCPNCKCNLHPACPQCKREIGETDKFCPYCAQDLAAVSIPSSGEIQS